MKLSQLKLDQDATVNGVWRDLGQGLEILVARARNPEFVRYLEQLSKPYLRQIRDGTMAKDVSQRLYVKALARKVLRDWRGLHDDEGNEIPYTPTVAEELLSDEFCLLRDRVESLADELNDYLVKLEVDSVKN